MATLHASSATLSCLCNVGIGATAPPARSLKMAGGIKQWRTNGKKNRLFGKSDLFIEPSIVGRRLFASFLPRAVLQKTEQSSTSSSTTYNINKVLSYSFWTELGGHVKVYVRGTLDKYIVSIEAATHELLIEGELMLTWGMFRSDSSCFFALDSSKSSHGPGTTNTPFTTGGSGFHSVVLEFESEGSPFYLSFHLGVMMKKGSKISVIKSNTLKNFCIPIGFGSGRPAPLGLSFLSDSSMNFSIVSRNNNGVVLCLYDNTSVDKPALELDLDPVVNRTGDVWHASIGSAWEFSSYGYKFRSASMESEVKNNEEIFLDPYAKFIQDFTSPTGSGIVPNCLGYISKEHSFDWTGELRPNLPMENLIVYRLNVSRFTQDKSSQLSSNAAGTFAGVADMVTHFQNLGVNAILLEPVFPFDANKGPYFPYNFFTSSKTYGSSDDPFSSIFAMKEMVKSLHANGIEVLLEVVFTHSSENGATDDLGHRLSPLQQRIILDSLHHWVIEFHIDGFCFMNASCLLRDHDGKSLSRPPLVEAIAFDPLLSTAKIIADFWDPQSMKQRDAIFPHWKRWAEVNSTFCYDVRNFLRGKGALSHLATRLCGSGDKFFNGRGPAFSFNYFSRNFGLPLVDLVSFSDTELDSEWSWNCGEEGPTKKTSVLERRLKQIRNYFFILFVSLGVPVLNMGDECGQSSSGSISYHDRTPLDWNMLSTGFGTQIVQFISFLSSLRKRRSDYFQRNKFLDEDSIQWYGADLSSPKWDDPASKFLSVTLQAEEAETESELGNNTNKKGDIFMAFNVSNQTESVKFPSVPEGFAWHRLVDTALPFPGYFSYVGEPVVDSVAYEMKPNSCILFEAIIFAE